MKTGTCLRPSWMAIVWPIIAGTIIDRRDQVLMTCFEPLSFCESTFLIRWSSTNGPFFRLRGTAAALSSTLSGLAATDDHLIAGLALAGAALRLAPRRHRVASTRRLALAATVRMVDRVHRDTAYRRPLALPAHPAGLAPTDVGLLGVADLADRRAAADVDVAHLAGRQSQLSAPALLGDQLHAGSSRPAELRAAARTELDRVDRRSDRDVAQRQVVARLDVGADARLDPHALLEAFRRDDVALLAVDVVQQRDPSRPVRVVLDVRDLGRHAVLVGSAEVDDAVRALVTAALVPGGDPALVVAAALLGQRTHQTLLGRTPGDLAEVGH